MSKAQHAAAGLMPADAADLATASVEAAAAAASPDGAAEPDLTILATSSRVAAQQQQRAVSDMVQCKPGALVSSYLSQQQAAPTRLWQQHLAGAKDSTGSSRAALATRTSSSGGSTMARGATAAAGTSSQGGGDVVGVDVTSETAGPGPTSLRAQAAACMADAAAAVGKYERSKAAAAKGRRQARAAMSKQTAEMLQQLRDACASSRARQDCSNILSGECGVDATPAAGVRACLPQNVTPLGP
jgi:hypothetical protein